MIVHPSDLPQRSRFLKCDLYENRRFFIAWKGTIFQYGSKAGSDSIARLAFDLDSQPLSKLCRFLHGIFALFVFDKKDRIWRVTVDNAGQYHAFHSSECVGLSFLELLSMEGPEKHVLCPEAVAEFLGHGGVFWSRTLVRGIRKIAFNEVIELRPASGSDPAQKTIVQKEMTARGTVEETAFFDHYRYLAAALHGRRVSVDLTGGIDSRLLVCLLNDHRLEFEVAVAGRPGLPDVAIAEKAAGVLRRDLHLTRHDTSSIEEELPELFRQCDGLGDMLTYHLSRQLSADRQRRGIEVAISGVGGELYKDFWWLQDCPFYKSKNVNFERLYDLRIRPVGLPKGYLAGEVAAAYAQLRRRTIEEFNTLRAETNTESYDNVYFFYKMASGRFATSNINNYLAVVTPFLDYDNFLFGASLPRLQRFANRFHRMTLTGRCPDLASLVTTEGVRASFGKGSELINLFGFGMNRCRRLVRKLGERLFRRRSKSLSLADPSDPAMIPRIRRTSAFRSASEDLKDAGFLDPNLPLERIRDTEVGRMLTLGMLVRHTGR